MPDIATTPMPTESTADVEHELSGQLRADVRLLSTLLGEVLRESGSPRLFEDVEALRHASTRLKVVTLPQQEPSSRDTIPDS